MFIPHFPHVQSDLNRCFEGGKKNHNNEETPYNILTMVNGPTPQRLGGKPGQQPLERQHWHLLELLAFPLVVVSEQRQ